MKTKILLLAALAFIAQSATTTEFSGADAFVDRTDLPTINHNSFQAGEKLEFSINYGFVHAANAQIEIKEKKQKIAGRDVLHIVGTGKSRGTFDFFFKVRDRYETYLDEEGVFPWKFVRDVSEGGYEFSQEYDFDAHRNRVKTHRGQTHKVPENVQDMLSAFYKARTLDLNDVKPGDIFTIEAFVDEELYPLQIKFKEFETIEIDKGKFRCMRFVPIVQKGRIFKEEDDLSVWISDDRNKIPVLAKADILFGALTMELTDYEGLANPVAQL